MLGVGLFERLNQEPQDPLRRDPAVVEFKLRNRIDLKFALWVMKL